MKLLTTFLFLGILSAQSEHQSQSIETVVNQFMQAINTNDADLAQSLVLEDAMITRVLIREGISNSKNISMNQFIEDIRTRTIEVEERIWNLKIESNDNIATAWMDYDFHIEGNYSHQGSNVLFLIKTSDGWKISQVLFDMQI